MITPACPTACSPRAPPFSPPPPASLTGSLPAVGRVVLQRCPLPSLSLLSCEWSSRVEGVHYVHHAGPQVGLHEEGPLYTISVSVWYIGIFAGAEDG